MVISNPLFRVGEFDVLFLEPLDRFGRFGTLGLRSVNQQGEILIPQRWFCGVGIVVVDRQTVGLTGVQNNLGRPQAVFCNHMIATTTIASG